MTPSEWYDFGADAWMIVTQWPRDFQEIEEFTVNWTWVEWLCLIAVFAYLDQEPRTFTYMKNICTRQ